MGLKYVALFYAIKTSPSIHLVIAQQKMSWWLSSNNQVFITPFINEWLLGIYSYGDLILRLGRPLHNLLLPLMQCNLLCYQLKVCYRFPKKGSNYHHGICLSMNVVEGPCSKVSLPLMWIIYFRNRWPFKWNLLIVIISRQEIAIV